MIARLEVVASATLAAGAPLLSLSLFEQSLHASATACVRLVAPSLRIARLTYTRTVSSERPRIVATSSVVLPAAVESECDAVVVG
jgi:hypothetical protein